MQLPHKRQTAGRSVVACDSNSARTPGQVFPSQQVRLNEQRQQDHAAQRGRDAFGTATRISASLFRRLSVFFESTPDQGPKAAKFAVLPPGHAGFPKRAERSEGSDTTPTQNTTCFAVCALVCDPLSKSECIPTFARESERGPFVREVEKHDEKRGSNLWHQLCPIFSLLLIVGGHREPGNVCI